MKQVKVNPNVKVHPDQIKEIKGIADESHNSYSDMFRMILTIGIQAFKSQMSVSDKSLSTNQEKSEE